jgi:hypothetical protein
MPKRFPHLPQKDLFVSWVLELPFLKKGKTWQDTDEKGRTPSPVKILKKP